MEQTKNKSSKRVLTLFLLIVAGSVIYELPYIRYNYYDAMMEALNVNHTQMGSLMSIFGFVAMICYFPGGWIADKFSCKKLLTISLVSTGAIGLYFATFPSYNMSIVVHILWGISVTLTFWAAMLKATRLLGDSSQQGRLFGILEGGRGLLPALYGFAFLAIFNQLGAQLKGFRAVVIAYSVICIIGGILVLAFLDDGNVKDQESTAVTLKDLKVIVKMPAIWLVSLIIFSSYIMYSAQSYITPYMTELFGASESSAALVGLIRVYFIAIFFGPIGGYIADKIGSTIRVLLYSFIAIALACFLFCVIPTGSSHLWQVIAAMILLAAGVFMTRGIYFAAIDEIKVPLAYTGCAVGLASFIGFMPEAFIYILVGNWLDRYPGAAGYHIMFIFMTVMGVIGLAVCALLLRNVKKIKAKTDV